MSTSPLNVLTNLTNLYLGYTDTIKDISFIKSMKKLKSLGLAGMDLTNISALKSCNNLEDLNLCSNNISDLTPLKGLTRLKKLELSINEINNLSPLKDLKSLKYLGLMHNNIENILDLRNLDRLEHLYLRGNKISNFSCVKPYYNNLKEKDFEPNVLLSALKYSNYTSTEGCSIGYCPTLYDCIVFHMYDGMDLGENNMQSLEYDINAKYNFFEGVFSDFNINYESNHETRIKIWGDDKLLYASEAIKFGDDPIPFRIDISGVNNLIIQIESSGNALCDDSEYILSSPYLY